MESTLEQKKATVPEQRVAVITGASQGIGAALVKAYRESLAAGGHSSNAGVRR